MLRQAQVSIDTDVHVKLYNDRPTAAHGTSGAHVATPPCAPDSCPSGAPTREAPTAMAAKHHALGLIALATLATLALVPRGAQAAAAPRCNCSRNTTADGTPSDAGTAASGRAHLASALCMPRSVLASTDVEACATFATRGFYRGSAMRQFEPDTAPDGLAWTQVSRAHVRALHLHTRSRSHSHTNAARYSGSVPASFCLPVADGDGRVHAFGAPLKSTRPEPGPPRSPSRPARRRSQPRHRTARWSSGCSGGRAWGWHGPAARTHLAWGPCCMAWL